MKKITDAQRRVLDSINKFRKNYGYSPTVREIAEDLSLKSTKAVFIHLKNLQKNGQIEKTDRRSRAISAKSGFSIVPLLGRISAGIPLNSESSVEDAFLMEGVNKERFFLKINGDSMIDAGLDDKGMVLIEKSLRCVNGDIVVVLLNGELTIKRLKTENNRISLIPENKKYKPIDIKETDEFLIIGKVVGYVKSI